MNKGYEYDTSGEECLGNAQGHLWSKYNNRCISCGEERHDLKHKDEVNK